MSMIKISDFKEALNELEHNPLSIQRLMLDAVEEVHNGQIEVIDAATPFGFALQATAAAVSTAIDQAVALNRKQYPVAAQNEEDLYLHMSDRDYINRFAIPSTAKFFFIFDKNELLQKMVTDTELGIRKLIIPRNTYVTVNNVRFTLQYPIEIRQLKHGGIQIVYNNEIETPVQTLESNLIDYYTREDHDIEWLYFLVPLTQVNIRTLYTSTDDITVVKESIVLEDKFYYLRAFMQDSSGQWSELYTTHTDQIYDYNRLTVCLRVYQDKVEAKIPQIYHTRGMVTGRIRFDLYETRGAMNMDLRVFPEGVYTANFTPDDFDIASSKYSAPLSTFKSLSFYSEDITDGGNDPISLDQLRENVIGNSVGAQIIPITPTQIRTRLNRSGFDIVKNIDNLTNRAFLATKQLPQPTNPDLVTAASASIESILLSENEIAEISTIKQNDRSATITPDTLFRNEDGVIKFVSDAKVAELKRMNPELLANDVSRNSYFYTPFHYVMEFGMEEFAVRPYYLDKPVAMHRSFVSENNTTLTPVSIDEFEIIRTENGYQINMSVNSSDAYKELRDEDIYVQLAFKPTGEQDYAYLNGELIGFNADNERIFSFNLDTNFHVNDKDEINLSTFRIHNRDGMNVYSVLENDFEVLFSTAQTMPRSWRPDEVDRKLGKFLLPKIIYGISNERIRIRFGHALKNLWSRNRSIISTDDYEYYDADVPLVHLHDVLNVDPATNSAIRIVNGRPQMTYKARAGDPVLDADGAPVYKHRRGDVKLDEYGKPILRDNYGLLRQIEVLLVEGAYWFATSEVITDYRQELTDTFINDIVDGLGELDKHLLEQTDIYYYPKSTVGPIDVMINNSIRTIIESGQSFNVRLYVSSIVYTNADLCEELRKATVRTINEQLSEPVVSRSGIVKALSAAYGDDVISIRLLGLGGDEKTDTITVLDDAKRCSVRKRLVSQGDGSLFVEEAVTVEFVKHDIKELEA